MSAINWRSDRPPFLGQASEPEDRRAEIMRAAVQVFARKGYHGCRMADVAGAAGVAYGLIYHYFRNKEELLSAVITETLAHFARLIQQILTGEGSIPAKLEALIATAFEACREDPEAVRVIILSGSRGPAFLDTHERGGFAVAQQAIARLLEQGIAQGALRADIDAEAVAHCLLGVLESALTTFIVDPDWQSPERMEVMRRNLVVIFLRGALRQLDTAEGVAG